MWDPFSSIRDLGRLHEIGSVLVRYGFGDLVRRIGLAGALERAGQALHWRQPEELAHLQPPTRVRRALETLGPTFVKFGQVLSTRVDLFTPDWIAELSKLQNQTPVLPFDAIREQLVEDLGGPPEGVFAQLDTEAMAAASLAQVYRARLQDGTPVILKVRRPGIRPIIEADLRLLARLAEMAESQSPDLRRYRVRDIVEQFARSMRRELDFAAEGRSAERVARHFTGRDEIVIPRVHWTYTGERLNVQDDVEGIGGQDIAGIEAAGMSRRLLARRGAEAVLKMMLEDGFFHADPHPGNVCYLPGNRVAFYDFGMVGRLSEDRRLEIVLLLNGLVAGNADAVSEILLDWGGDEIGSAVDSGRLRSDIDDFIDQYRGVPLRELDMGSMMTDLTTLLRAHALLLPPDLSLLIKSFITLEGMGRTLDPEFDMASMAQPFLARVLKDAWSPKALATRTREGGQALMWILGKLPRDLNRTIRLIRRGRIGVDVDVGGLERFGNQVDKAITRLTMGIVTAALIVGSSIVMNSQNERLSGWLSLGTVGFLAAAVGGVALLISSWRSGRSRPDR